MGLWCDDCSCNYVWGLCMCMTAAARAAGVAAWQHSGGVAQCGVCRRDTSAIRTAGVASSVLCCVCGEDGSGSIPQRGGRREVAVCRSIEHGELRAAARWHHGEFVGVMMMKMMMRMMMMMMLAPLCRRRLCRSSTARTC